MLPESRLVISACPGVERPITYRHMKQENPVWKRSAGRKTWGLKRHWLKDEMGEITPVLEKCWLTNEKKNKKNKCSPNDFFYWKGPMFINAHVMTEDHRLCCENVHSSIKLFHSGCKRNLYFYVSHCSQHFYNCYSTLNSVCGAYLFCESVLTQDPLQTWHI